MRTFLTLLFSLVTLGAAGQWVDNRDGILSAQTAAEIDRLCADLNDKHIAQVAVLVLNSVPDDQLELFAHRRLNELGVGEKGKDNGLVISVVREQRDIQFATGYGLEGVLPDALCKRIQTLYMVGPLGAGNWDEGVSAGVRAVYNVLIGDQQELTALAADDVAVSGKLILGAVLLLVLLIVIVVGSAFRHGGRKGGPGGSSGTGTTGGPGSSFGSFLAGLLLGGGLGGRGGFGGPGGGFGGGGFGGGFGGGRSGGGGSRSGF